MGVSMGQACYQRNYRGYFQSLIFEIFPRKVNIGICLTILFHSKLSFLGTNSNLRYT